MKRYGNLADKLLTLENIYLADANARKNKVNRLCVLIHNEHIREENELLLKQLTDKTYKTSEYQLGKVYEPKERIIYKLPYYPDRITHHAIVNVVKDIWTKNLIHNTYSCIEGRGIHACAKDVKKALRTNVEGTKYCLKLDITKFYPSIPHEGLKKCIRKKIKDKHVLYLLDEIISSTDKIDGYTGKGVPIGNYLSQFFANIYLSELDHLCKEELKCKYYFRYADDIVILHHDKDFLHKALIYIKLYLATIGLKVKPNYQVFPVEARGIDFVGYKFYHTYTLVRKRIKTRVTKLVNRYKDNKIDKVTFKAKMASYYGWLKFADTKHYLHNLETKVNIKYSNWKGIDTTMTNFYNKTIRIIDILYFNKYYKICCIRNRKKYTIKSADKFILNSILKMDKLPVNFKVVKYNPRWYSYYMRKKNKIYPAATNTIVLNI